MSGEVGVAVADVDRGPGVDGLDSAVLQGIVEPNAQGIGTVGQALDAELGGAVLVYDDFLLQSHVKRCVRTTNAHGGGSLDALAVS